MIRPAFFSFRCIIGWGKKHLTTKKVGKGYIRFLLLLCCVVFLILLFFI